MGVTSYFSCEITVNQPKGNRIMQRYNVLYRTYTTERGFTLFRHSLRAFFVSGVHFSLRCNFIWSSQLICCQNLGHNRPVTMIVPASCHQVRCISWVQMGTFNEKIGFLSGLKFFALNIFCGEYLQSSLHLMLQIWWKPLLWKMYQ